MKKCSEEDVKTCEEDVEKTCEEDVWRRRVLKTWCGGAGDVLGLLERLLWGLSANTHGE